MAGVALTAMVALTACGPKASAPAEGDMAMGAPEGAKVTVVEYASVTCHALRGVADRELGGLQGG